MKIFHGLMVLCTIACAFFNARAGGVFINLGTLVCDGTGATELAPTIYYCQWRPFYCVDPITNRNGLFYDILRAVFPKAKFVRYDGSVRFSAPISRDSIRFHASSVDPAVGQALIDAWEKASRPSRSPVSWRESASTTASVIDGRGRLLI